MAGITPPVVTVSAGSRTIEIDTGELLFPALVLAFCLVYYWDTHALPDLSMLYAGPLLYTTAALAVVTLLGQAVSVDDRPGKRGADEAAPEPAEPEADPGAEHGAGIESGTQASSGPHFTIRNAALLAAATAAYIVAIEPIGFLPTTIGYLAFALYLFGERSPLRLAAYSIGFAFVVWLVFVQWLMVPL
ncbi:tripartite tricarboxylate transporter TctB family protein [Halalkalicoccus tibetensis]|uniref:Tripartite tricarboxylate transporter TctB family protein n=1 Tax=Halalkalicoccus tibetensis TaxID=175632 RepID=A0ABD5V8R9_9EURY